MQVAGGDTQGARGGVILYKQKRNRQ